jgi:hypothetical protein
MFALVPESPAGKGMGLGPDLHREENDQNTEVVESHYELRERLVEHFTRKVDTNSIVWPRVR